MVANQESDWVSTLGERPRDVPRLLRHPVAVGIRRAAGQVHATAGDFDEEQHVQPLEPDGVDGEEIHCNGALRLRAQELTPRRTLAVTCWTELLVRCINWILVHAALSSSCSTPPRRSRRIKVGLCESVGFSAADFPFAGLRNFWVDGLYALAPPASTSF